MNNESVIDILEEEIDEETLYRMPGWFKLLRDNYGKNSGTAQTKVHRK